jgi:hypothetical protein
MGDSRINIYNYNVNAVLVDVGNFKGSHDELLANLIVFSETGTIGSFLGNHETEEGAQNIGRLLLSS